MKGMPTLFDISQKRPAPGALYEIVSAITDPVIVPRSPWVSSIPAWLKHQVTLARMIDVMRTKGKVEMATDAEACAYLMPLTLEFPIPHEWAEIYLYVSTKVCRAAGKDVPQDIAVEKLDSYSEDELKHLKRWIYRKRLQCRKTRQRRAKEDGNETFI